MDFALVTGREQALVTLITIVSVISSSSAWVRVMAFSPQHTQKPCQSGTYVRGLNGSRPLLASSAALAAF